ncbi:hypothetical protein KDD17_07190 [Sulfitobacter albidus]|uniref:Lipoprotein n=1 Tax=Sulfitobacter albidus TaxID=2829501 RepID=A0A975JG77_9RHOB|nr:hypothetical protein [Sulfitobacter albidus]QUJ77727.1 hypothetical protein KDD17_07190 [Sulfitobacter albidus]
MRSTLPLLLIAATALGGCAVVRDSAVNPANWFGRSAPAPVAAEDAKPVNPLIPQGGGGLFGRRAVTEETYEGRPFEEVVDLKVERVPGGAIIRATGRAARQGIYSVQLTPANEDELPENGVLVYRLEGVRPDFNTPVGTQPTREVTAGRRLSDQQLRGVRSIRVEGTQSARVARR